LEKKSRFSFFFLLGQHFGSISEIVGSRRIMFCVEFSKMLGQGGQCVGSNVSIFFLVEAINE